MTARDMFYPENKNYSNSEERAYAREDLVYNVTEDILVIMEDMDLSKKELAERLGKSKSYVTQILSGARNMTLGSLSDICFAIGVEPKIVLPVAPEAPEEQVASWEGWEAAWVEDTQRKKPKHMTLRFSNVIEFPKDRAFSSRDAA